MIHSKMVKPRAFPWNSARAPEQINRLQEITGDLTLNRDKMYEIGRVGLLGYRQRTPAFAGRFRQYENGDMAFWYDLANVVTPTGGDPHSINLDSIKTTYTDISAYLTDDNGTFTGTIWFPKLRVSSFTLNIADPDAILERSINLVGEDYKILDGNYFAYKTQVVSAPGEEVIDLTGLAPVEFASDQYIFRVLRIRAGIVSDLVKDSTGVLANSWSYNIAGKLVIVKDCLASDRIKVYYESATAYTTVWTNDDVNEKALLAEYCEIFIKFGTGTRVYRLQTVGIDVAFERADYKEIGNSEIVQTGVKNATTKIALNRFTEGFSLEDILAGDTTYPYIDPSNFKQTIQLMVKVYKEKEHTNFKIGYLMNNISPTAIGTSQATEDYNKGTTSLECDNLLISDLVSEIVFS